MSELVDGCHEHHFGWSWQWLYIKPHHTGHSMPWPMSLSWLSSLIERCSSKKCILTGFDEGHDGGIIKMEWLFRYCEMSSMKMINRRGLVWSHEVPQHWFFSLLQWLIFEITCQPSIKGTWKTQYRKFLKQTTVPHTAKSSADLRADDLCFFSVVERVGKTLRSIMSKHLR